MSETRRKWKYVQIRLPSHPRSSSSCRVFEHILVVEKALGKFLMRPAEVHHINDVSTDNRPENLVACQDGAYHKLLHRRQRALAACGHADWRKCVICGIYSPLEDLFRQNQYCYAHRACNNLVRRQSRKALRGTRRSWREVAGEERINANQYPEMVVRVRENTT